MISQIQPWIDKDEWKEVKKVLKSTFLTENKATERFEKLVRVYTGSRYAISVNNATVGLYCCLKALGIGDNPNDEVIVPDMTFIATANAVIMAGAKPVFCDVELDTVQMSTSNLGGLVNKNTKTVIPVHLYGYAADIVNVRNFCLRNNLHCVEDAAQGLGVFNFDKSDNLMGKHVGTFGKFGVISFYGNKSITTGEGGVILTNDTNLADRCYRLKNHGRNVKGTFIHDTIGFNFSFTDLQAAVGIAQLKKYNKILNRKRDIYHKYEEGFSGLIESGEIVDIKRYLGVSPNYWFSSFLVKARDKNNLQDHLKQKGIQTRNFFYPLHSQPCYHKSNKVIIREDGYYRNSNELFSRGLSFPSSYSLKNKELDMVIDSVLEYYYDKVGK